MEANMKKLFWNKWIGFLVIVFFSFSIFTGCVSETVKKQKKELLQLKNLLPM